MTDQRDHENNLPEGFKMTELGSLPEEWEVVRLGDVLQEVNERARDFDNDDANTLAVLSLTKNQGIIFLKRSAPWLRSVR
jgi:hypothetical protein